jgi:hypothetical protein
MCACHARASANTTLMSHNFSPPCKPCKPPEVPPKTHACCAGNAGFIIVSANTTLMNHDFFQVGSLYSQCTVTTFADKTKPPVYSANCALGKPNACCNATPNTCS